MQLPVEMMVVTANKHIIYVTCNYCVCSTCHILSVTYTAKLWRVGSHSNTPPLTKKWISSNDNKRIKEVGLLPACALILILPLDIFLKAHPFGVGTSSIQSICSHPFVSIPSIYCGSCLCFGSPIQFIVVMDSTWYLVYGCPFMGSPIHIWQVLCRPKWCSVYSHDGLHAVFISLESW